MRYKNLNLAFLIEVFVGFGCILSISLLGSKGLVSLALIGLRPFLLETEPITNEKLYWRFSYKVFLNSAIIISLMIISILIIIQFIPQWKMKLPALDIILVEIIPFFVLTHGVLGFINLSFLDKS